MYLGARVDVANFLDVHFTTVFYVEIQLYLLWVKLGNFESPRVKLGKLPIRWVKLGKRRFFYWDSCVGSVLVGQTLIAAIFAFVRVCRNGKSAINVGSRWEFLVVRRGERLFPGNFRFWLISQQHQDTALEYVCSSHVAPVMTLIVVEINGYLRQHR